MATREWHLSLHPENAFELWHQLLCFYNQTALNDHLALLELVVGRAVTVKFVNSNCNLCLVELRSATWSETTNTRFVLFRILAVGVYGKKSWLKQIFWLLIHVDVICTHFNVRRFCYVYLGFCCPYGRLSVLGDMGRRSGVIFGRKLVFCWGFSTIAKEDGAVDTLSAASLASLRTFFRIGIDLRKITLNVGSQHLF